MRGGGGGVRRGGKGKCRQERETSWRSRDRISWRKDAIMLRWSPSDLHTQVMCQIAWSKG